LTPPRVVVVSGDESLLAAARIAFAERGWEVVATRTAADAAGEASAGYVSVAVVDGNLDEGEALRAVEQLRAAGAAVPVIFVASAERDPAGALALGATDFVTRPLVPVELGRRVALALERRPREPAPAVPFQDLRLASGSLAHDFNNILTTILGYLDLALGAGPTAVRGLHREHLEHALRATERACELAPHFVAAAKPGRSSRRLPQAIDSLVRGCSDLVGRAVSPELGLETRLAADDTFVNADSAGLERLLLGAILAVRDARSDGGPVRIGSSRVLLDPAAAREARLPPGLHALVTISGSGLAATLARSPELALAEALVADHGGSLAISRTAAGAGEVRIHLPAVAPAAQQGRPPEPTKLSPRADEASPSEGVPRADRVER
jgi:CheY-like chemotaxis protein